MLSYASVIQLKFEEGPGNTKIACRKAEMFAVSVRKISIEICSKFTGPSGFFFCQGR